jgi:hypothetical protein
MKELRRAFYHKGEYKMVTVLERYTDEKGIPREKLSCGHERIDPITYYGGEMTFKMKRLFEAINPDLSMPIKGRCYKCAKEEK